MYMLEFSGLFYLELFCKEFWILITILKCFRRFQFFSNALSKFIHFEAFLTLFSFFRVYFSLQEGRSTVFHLIRLNKTASLNAI